MILRLLSPGVCSTSSPLIRFRALVLGVSRATEANCLSFFGDVPCLISPRVLLLTSPADISISASDGAMAVSETRGRDLAGVANRFACRDFLEGEDVEGANGLGGSAAVADDDEGEATKGSST